MKPLPVDRNCDYLVMSIRWKVQGARYRVKGTRQKKKGGTDG